MTRLKLGFVVNPIAGIGGSVGLKGSDGQQTQTRARELGGKPRSFDRAAVALASASDVLRECDIVTFDGAMGADVLEHCGLDYACVGESDLGTGEDTRKAVRAFVDAHVDVIIFVGGDGTARDLIGQVGATPVIGVPAGVKMHSGVFLSHPQRLGELVELMVQGGLVAARIGEVKDIDESALRADRLGVRFFGELPVPEVGGYLQHVKEGGVEKEELVVEEIVADVSERVARWLEQQSGPVVFCPGSTVAAIERGCGFASSSTLLGIDATLDGIALEADIDATRLEELVAEASPLVIVSFSRGQGALLGRGNLQLTPAVLAHVAKEDLIVVGSRTKLKSLAGRPLFVDTGSTEIDQRFAGLIEITAGYEDRLWYRVDGGSGGAGGVGE